MADPDLASLKRQRNDISNRIERTNNEIANIKGQIERLNIAKRNVAASKSTANELKDKATPKKVSRGIGLNWKGKNYDDYTSYLNGEVKSDFGSYIDNGIDNCLDRIVDEITKYENEILRKRTLLSGLWTSFNSLSGWIEKLIN